MNTAAILKIRFEKLFRKYTDEEQLIQDAWTNFHNAYTGSDRHYHNLQHIFQMFVVLEEYESEVKNLDALSFSIFYHDIIYKATRKDNEIKSALYFKNVIESTSFNDIPHCIRQIEGTKLHEWSADFDTNLLMDLDLSILGQPSSVYNQYTANIRKEYRIYPDFLYYKGRKKVLVHFLEMEHIFKTKSFIEKFGLQARSNLNRELESLL